jgi:hypothetical protein
MTPLLFMYLFLAFGFSGVLIVVVWAWFKDRKDKK